MATAVAALLGVAVLAVAAVVLLAGKDPGGSTPSHSAVPTGTASSPFPLPSGLPSSLPSGLPPELPSGLPSGFPSTLPSTLPSGLPTDIFGL
ncbi:hypothetical protein [Streptomyces abikoensis]|uniref:hypothetical protein n=1 Tax=Streptomyces abikoensis TaxID=97398 RepID=UPI00340C7CD6